MSIDSACRLGDASAMASTTAAFPTFRVAFYALACVMGAASTWYFNLRYLAAHGDEFGLSPFVAEAFATNAAGSLGADILVAAMAGVAFIFIEARRIGMRHAWVYAFLACSVAFAAAFPLFLLMRERRLFALSLAGKQAP